MSVIIQDQAQFYAQAYEHFRTDAFNRCRGYRKYVILDHSGQEIIRVANNVDVNCNFLGTWNTPTTTHYIYGLQATDEQAMMIKMAL